MGEVELTGEAALLYAERFDVEVIVADVIRTSPARARMYLAEMAATDARAVLASVRPAKKNGQKPAERR